MLETIMIREPMLLMTAKHRENRQMVCTTQRLSSKYLEGTMTAKQSMMERGRLLLKHMTAKVTPQIE